MEPKMEQTLVIIKPDAVERGLTDKIIRRFERHDLKIVEKKTVEPDKALIEKHYEVHEGKPFYDKLVKFMTSGPMVPMILEGEDAIEKVREMIGPTKDAPKGTIRGDFAEEGASPERNIVHASDSPESVEREINLWFGEKNE
jgi:nucleoside-diphosphate kinase